MQTAFGLLPHVNLAQLIGAAGPSLWAVADSDTNPFAVGDLVVDAFHSIAGVPVVRLVGGTPQLVGPFDRSRSLLESISNSFGVIVGVFPASPGDEVQPTIAAGGGSGRSVWVLVAGAHLFDVAGDGATPARADLPASGAAPYTLTAQSVNASDYTGSLAYAPPSGGRSGSMLQGASFSTSGRGELVVVGLAPGAVLGPGEIYRVRLRTPSPQGPALNAVQWQPSSDGL